jgi:sulfite exporter TauE/SafE/copper chaperone CopZ
VEGMSCAGCKAKIEAEVRKLPGVQSVRVEYGTGEGVVKFDDSQVSQKRIFKTIATLGYRVKRAAVPERRATSVATRYGRWIAAGVVLALFVLAYVVVQRLGLLQLLARLNEHNLSYGLIFVIGLLASFHCVGMCGGLVVTYTARQQAQGEGANSGVSSHLLYNLGRVVSYTATGAILGGFGSFFAISPVFTGAVTVLAALFMLLMGLSLLTEFRFLKRFELALPGFVGRFLYGQQGSPSPKGPLVIGLLNGLMPCGPLQAMQLYALASGNVVRGALSMAAYALGTVPMMFGLGNVVSMLSAERTRQALKVSGAIVIVLGVFMLNRGLDNFGLGIGGFPTEVQPVAQVAVKPRPTSASPTASAPADSSVQVVHMKLTRRGYEPNVLHAKVGVQVRWVIDVVEMSGCTNRLIMPEYKVNKSFKLGENVIEFTPQRTGELKFSCWMQMVWGKFIVEA